MWEEEASEWPRTGICSTFTVESVDETVEWYHRMFGWNVGSIDDMRRELRQRFENLKDGMNPEEIQRCRDILGKLRQTN